MAHRSDKDINLYKALKSTKTKNNNKSSKLPWIMPPVLIVLLLGGAFAYFYFQNIKTQAEINQIDKYVNSAQTVEKHKESEELQKRQQEITNEKKRLEKFNETLKTYPKLNVEVFRKIEENIKDTIIIYDIIYADSNGFLQMEASALDIGAASKFAQDLYSTGLFEKVNYKGWSLGSNNRYTFNVNCILKAEKPEVNE